MGHMQTIDAIMKDAVVCDLIFPMDPPHLRLGCPPEYIDRYRTSGVSYTSIGCGSDFDDIAVTIQRIAYCRRFIRDRADTLVLVENVEDVLAAKRDGKLAVGLQVHGLGGIGKNLGLLEVYHALGLRIAQLVFNASNGVGGGASDRVDGGLTTFGVKALREIERLGILVDLSHTGYRTTMDAMELATRPVVFSHVAVHALNAHYRNVRDDQALALARNGGLIGITGSSGYLGDRDGAMATVFRHIDHLVQLIGPSHVALGFDFVFEVETLNDWVRENSDEWPDAQDPRWPGFQFQSPEKIPELVGLMLSAGYAREDVMGIVGGNFMRIVQQIWR